MQANQTFMDAQGNQFFMVPVNLGQNPPMIQLGPTQNPFKAVNLDQEMSGRGWRGRSCRGSTKHF